MIKKVLKVVLVFVVGFCTLQLTNTKVLATEKEYEIYPKPHAITYQEGEYVMREKVNVVYDDTIDIATKNRLTEVLKTKGKDISLSNQKDETQTNVFIGTYASTGPAFGYINENYSLDAGLKEKKEGHQIISKNGEIVIVGINTDAVFSGITSLKHIFNQIDGSTLRNFEIKDYADTAIRGFIEGYYGIPWSNEDRNSLMKFGGDFKMNAYIFAPKDDPYHSGKWREPYPEDKLAGIKEMVMVGEASKCRFVWTIHPFMNGGMTEASYDQDIQKIINKFEQLYAIGVRQFGVLGDDASSLPRAVVVKTMNALQSWSNSKGDVYDLVFCPEGYNTSWFKSGELDQYDTNFDKSIHIFWTGDSVCSPVSQSALNNFKNYDLPAGNAPRRSPLFWLNWPVNDINGARLMMGKGSLLQTNINIDDLTGVVTNPMQEAEASKVALFAVADYSWNVKDFDDDTSWADSFKYIDEDAGEYLHTLAKHMSNPQPNGHGLILAESEELKPLINDFKSALTSSNEIVIKEKGNQLIKEMDIIINACNGYSADSKNKNMVKELEPFTGSLKELSQSIKEFVQAKIALLNKDSMSAFNYFTNATATLVKSAKHGRQQISNIQNVSPGSTELIPLARFMQDNLKEDVGSIVDGEEEKLVITASSSFNTFQQGPIENIIDKNLSTPAWYNGYEAKNQFYQVNLSIPSTIYGIDILNGVDNKPTDTFGYAKLEYSKDNGLTWNNVNDTIYGEYVETVTISGVQLEGVTNVRYICTAPGTGNKWPSMREFNVATDRTTAPEVTSEVIRTTDGWAVYGGKESNAIDGDDSTGVTYAVRNVNGVPDKDTTIEGDYFGVKLSQPTMLGKIHILQGPSDNSDYFKNVDLQYSVNGMDWIKIETYKEQRAIDLDLSDQNIIAQYVRLKNNARQENWVGMREFQVKAKVFFNAVAYTNVESLQSKKGNVFDDRGELEAVSNITLQKDEYIGIQLKRIHQLKNIITDLSVGGLTLQVSRNGFEWEEVAAGELSNTARYIRLINKTTNSITFDMNVFSAETNEIQPKKVYSTNGFSIDGSALNVFDNEWASQTIFAGSQVKGRNFVYDLGQTITLNQFKAVCRDSEGDFPRHGDFLVSSNGTDWESIMTIGNQDSANIGESQDTDVIGDALPKHEISYNTKEVVGLDKKIRYIKFEITRTKEGSDKWVRFQEFVINGGEFLPTENNPTIETTCKETSESKFANMLDGDLSTMFTPSEKDNSFIYSVSENNDKLKTVKIIQDSNKISDATVKVRLLTTTRSSNWVELGTLSQTINEFNLPANATILDVKVEWMDIPVAISHISLSTKTAVPTNKTELNTLLNNKEVVTNWTTDSQNAYNSAIATGEKINISTGATQSSVESAITLIKNAINNKLEKGNINELQVVIDNAYTDASLYTTNTWKVYYKAVENGKVAITNKDNLSQNKIDTFKTEIDIAKTALVFSPINLEKGILMSQDTNGFISAIMKPEELYTKNSFEALTTSNMELNDLIRLNKTVAQSPTLFLEITKKVEEEKKNLVSVDSLPALIKEFELLDESMYMGESYKTYELYKNAIIKAKGFLIDGTKENITATISEIAKVKEELVFVVNLSNVKTYIKDIEKLSKEEYTKMSLENLLTLKDTIKSKIDTASISELEAYATGLINAKNGLVSIATLKLKVHQARAMSADAYTTSSYTNLTKEVELAEKLYIDGSQSAVAISNQQLGECILQLKIRVDEKEAKSFIQSLNKVSGEAYTKESYDKYETAYKILKEMLTRLDDVEGMEYMQAKANYEKAYYELTLKPNVPISEVGTGDYTNPMIYTMMGCVALCGVVLLKKNHRRKETIK